MEHGEVERSGHISEKTASSIFREEHNPDDAHAYYAQKLQEIHAGKPTWMARNLESEHGRVYDYFLSGEQKGFVHEEYDLGIKGCMPYSTESEEPFPLSEVYITVSEAVVAVEASAN